VILEWSEAIPAKLISMESTTLYNMAALTSRQNGPNIQYSGFKI